MTSVPGFFAQTGLVATTLTGVDEQTDLDRALSMSRQFPFLEWGILLGSHPSPRYPAVEFIRQWGQRCREQHARSALHLCGGFARRWIENDDEVVELARLFDRVQVNVVASRTDVPALVDAVKSARHPRVITQHNAANQAITDLLMNEAHHAVLFDASGGRGEPTRDWPPHILGKACGYAGGLSPETVVAELDRIAPIAGPAFWIDMEGRVRTPEDALDLDRCEQVVSQVASWLHARG